MHELADLFPSRATAAILGLLFVARPACFHVREIARRAGLDESTIRQELRRLCALGVVEVVPDGNRKRHRANRRHPASPDLRSLVNKSVGVEGLLRYALIDPAVTVAFAHGPDLPAIGRFGCPVRIFLVGTITPSRADRMLSGIGFHLGRRITVRVLSHGNFARKCRDGDAEVAAALATPRIMLRGTERDLQCLREGRKQW